MPRETVSRIGLLAVPYLTDEERELARLIALDLDLQAIAGALTAGGLSAATERIAALCQKLNVLTLKEAGRRTRELGLQ